MATIAGNRVDGDDGSVTVIWTNLAQATSDVGGPAYIGDLVDVCVQARGTNTNTVEIQGSNDGSVYAALGAGQTLTIGASTSSPIQNLLARAKYIRPNTPSAGADTDVILVGYKRGTR